MNQYSAILHTLDDDDHCGKFKPKLVQKSFLRKSQDLHLDAVPTTYAKRSLRKKTRFPHKLSGSEQLNPFGHSLRGAVAKHEPKQNKLD